MQIPAETQYFFESLSMTAVEACVGDSDEDVNHPLHDDVRY